MKDDNSPADKPPPSPGHAAQVEERPSAELQHPEVFGVFDEIIEQLHLWIDDVDIPKTRTGLELVERACAVRAFNQYRAIVLLLRTNHWEDALILVRSLFELMLNVEELFRHELNLEGAAHRFYLFSLLQEHLIEREWVACQVARGRREAEVAIREMDAKALKVFALFRYRDRRGRGKWRTSWCNKDVATLCRESRVTHRGEQYGTVYAWGSQFVHGGPAPVFAAIDFPGAALTPDQIEERGLRLVGSLASGFVLELMLMIGVVLPKFSSTWVEGKLARIKTLTNGGG